MSEITPLPTPVPQRNDPSSFSLRADKFLTALPTFVTETNVVAGEVNTNAVNASTSATKSQNYATKTDGFAEGSDNSAKSWAVGGTGSGQPTEGSAKDWAISTSSPNGTTDKSAKTHADNAAISEENSLASAQLSKDWANKVSSTVDGVEYSSKEYAVGTTVTDGSAKDWANKTASVVASSEYSSKEYSVGITAPEGSSKQWATKTGSSVASGEYSSKEYSIGSVVPTGSAKDWANKTGSEVITGEYSSKEYAVGTIVPTGSAKDWAISATSPDGTSSKSAKSYAEDSAVSATASEASKVISVTKAEEASASAANAASSAATAEAIAASVGFQDVLFISSTNSPYTVDQTTSGKLIACDTSSGNVVVNLPLISGLTLPFVVGIKKTTSDSNNVIINRSGSDTFDDGTTSKIANIPSGYTLLPDTDKSPDVWAAIGFGGVGAEVVTSVAGRSGAVTLSVADISGATPTTNPSTSGTFTHSGDVVISGTGRKIKADFSNGTISNRCRFESSVTNSFTTVLASPNGTGTGSGFFASNSSDVSNASYLFISAAATYTSIVSGFTGSGVFLPINFQVGGSFVWSMEGAAFRPYVDNAITLGTASYRPSVIYAGSGTINTSDAREKTPVRPLTDSELAAAKQISSEIGAYRFLSAVVEKGDAAREHIGMTVQRAIEIMTAHGLDPFGYGFICHDTWDDDFEYIDPVTEQRETKPAVVAEDGTLIQEAEFEAVVIEPGYQKKVRDAGDRYSFRTDELLLFIARGFEDRLSILEGV